MGRQLLIIVAAAAFLVVATAQAPAPAPAPALGNVLQGLAQAVVGIANQSLAAIASANNGTNATAALPPVNGTALNSTLSAIGKAAAPLAQALNETLAGAGNASEANLTAGAAAAVAAAKTSAAGVAAAPLLAAAAAAAAALLLA